MEPDLDRNIEDGKVFDRIPQNGLVEAHGIFLSGEDDLVAREKVFKVDPDLFDILQTVFVMVHKIHLVKLVAFRPQVFLYGV